MDEPGAATVLLAMDRGAAIGAVSLAEVIEVAIRRGVPAARASAWAEELALPVIAFGAPMAARAAAVLAAFRPRGLALGDAACLGTAATLGLAVLTADRLWAALDHGVEVRQVR